MPAAKVTMPAKFSARNVGLVLLVMLASCNAGNVGNQQNKKPLAVATAVGAGIETGGRFQVRSGTEVLISGKDSDSDDAPILEFAWSQLSGDSVVLFERTTVARSFTAPSGPTTLVFELEVTNALGTTSTDIVTIDVIAVSDVNEFLRDPGVDEQFYLFVSPTTTAGSIFGSTIPYSLSVTPTVYWTDRSGSLQSQTLAPILTASDQLDAEFVVPASPVDSTQKRIAVPVPLLDADEVNRFFQTTARAARLELEEVGDATVELQIALTFTGTGSFEVFVGRRSGGSYAVIDGDDLFAGATTPIASGAVLTGTSGSDSVLIDLEKLRQELSIESSLSARNYYNCIDPMGDAATLDGWLTSVFDLADGSIASAQYTNNYDLGFARDMFLRQDSDGSVYTFVINHPSLEQLINGVGEFATVVMEYSAAPTGFCDNPSFPFPVTPATEKIVKFYAYVPDVTTGEMVRAESMNFDGRGERFLPGVCTACHDGNISNIAAFGISDPSTIAASNADLSATFMPWDIDSLLFADANDPSLIDPSLNPSEFTAAQLAAASLEGQQAALRALNEGALRTYQGDLRRYEEPLRLIHGWYGNESALPAPITDDPMTVPDETDDLSLTSPLEMVSTNVLTSLPAVDFDGTYVQAGWAGEETIYFDVYARYCRMCHTQQDQLSNNFDSHDEFVNAASRLTSFVFEQGVMPAARLTLDRFWVDFSGGSTPAAELLRDHLNANGASIASDLIPGRPVAVIQAVPTTVTAVDVAGELVATTINLDGTSSLFADTFSWSLTSDCGSVPTILGATSPQASFIADTSPCEYSPTLDIDSGLLSSQAIATVTTNRVPVISDLTVDLSVAGYTPGDTFVDMDVLAEIASEDDGDGSLTLVINDPTFGLAINANVTDQGNGVARIVFDALPGTMDSFQYQVQDLNGSTAVANKMVSVTITAIAPTLTTMTGTLTESSVTLEWTVPAGFDADNYRVFRDGPTPDGSFTEIGTTTSLSFPDSMLASNSDYDYRVDAELGTETSQSGTLRVSTITGAPTGLMLTGETATSISLNWTAGAGTSPSGYTIYADNSVVGTTVGAGSTTFTDTSLDQNTTYLYEVTQTVSGTESARSTSLMSTTDAAPPSSLSASPVTNTSDQISLAWLAPAGGTTPSSYNIYRAGVFIQNTASLSFTDTSLSSNTTFSYQVGSVGTNGESTRASTSATTNLSLSDVITSSGLTSATTNPGLYTSGCLTSLCHFGDSDATLRFRFELSCTTDDFDLGDCSTSMTGIGISSSFRSLLQLWIAAGAP